MKKFEAKKACLLFMVLLSVFIILPGCGGGGDTCPLFPPSSSKAITAFSFVGFPGYAGTINEAAKTITVTLPFGTNVTNLVAAFTTTGASVKVGTAAQKSGTTPNNFTTPVAYSVTASDGSKATYTVTVTLASNSAKAITAFSFVGFPAATGVINEAAKTIGVTLPFGTNLTNLIAKFTTTGIDVRVGATIQTSGSTANNFTNPVQYIVTAADSSTATYTVTVTVAPNSAKAITAYSFVGFTGAEGTIDEAASPKTITVPVPHGTDVTNLIATFTTTGTVVKVGTTVQTSSATANDFTNTVAYVVTAADNSTATYNVTVIVTDAPELGAIAPFGGFGGPAGMTNQGLLTVINGDIGTTGASTLITGFHDLGGNVYTETPLNQGFVNGTIYTATAPPGSVPGVVAAAAALAAQTAFDNLSPASLPGGTDPGAGQLGGLTLAPGIYQAAGGSFLLTGSDLTLDGGGDATAVFVFQMASTLTVGGPGAPRSIILINGAQAKNVYWYVGSAATINAAGGGTMVGTIIASAGVSFSTAGNVDIVTLNGRAIGLNASVTLVNTVVNVPAP